MKSVGVETMNINLNIDNNTHECSSNGECLNSHSKWRHEIQMGIFTQVVGSNHTWGFSVTQLPSPLPFKLHDRLVVHSGPGRCIVGICIRNLGALQVCMCTFFGLMQRNYCTCKICNVIEKYSAWKVTDIPDHSSTWIWGDFWSSHICWRIRRKNMKKNILPAME